MTNRSNILLRTIVQIKFVQTNGLKFVIDRMALAFATDATLPMLSHILRCAIQFKTPSNSVFLLCFLFSIAASGETEMNDIEIIMEEIQMVHPIRFDVSGIQFCSFLLFATFRTINFILNNWIQRAFLFCYFCRNSITLEWK